MEKKNNSGAIFKNKRKEKDTHPDYRGNVVVNGKEMEVVLWVKESKAGEKFFSAAFSEPYVAPERMERKPIGDSIDDGLPF